MTKTVHYILLLAILCGFLSLLFANISNQYLWQDEAETALVSKTILTGGLPRGYDGKNYFSQMEGADCGPSYIWRQHSWLPFYVLAGFYEVFGVNTFTARLPFMLFGFGTVLLTYFFSKTLWSNTHITFIAVVLLSISVPFLLLCRQCRYYSMVMFFSVLSLYAYTLFLERKKYAAVMIFAASTLLFHSQHLYIAVFFATILLHSIIYHRDRLKSLIVVTVVTAAANIPWIIWLATALSNPKARFTDDVSLGSAVKLIGSFISQIHHYVFPLWLLAVLATVILIKKINVRRYLSQKPLLLERVSLLIFFVLFNIIFLSAVTNAPYFRYIAPSIPLLIILIAAILEAAISVHLLAAVAIAVILIATGQLKDYLYEITHNYDGPIKGIVSYLNEHADSNDIVAITYGDLPLKFYTKLRIVGGMTGEDLEPAKNARWIIFRRYTHSEYDKKVMQYLIANTNGNNYRQIEINYPDTPWQNREDPAKHYFRTPTNESNVVIFEKIH
jgi:4-amino-4-deoxy-L-arabinose transferase-like glycosyltransferase